MERAMGEEKFKRVKLVGSDFEWGGGKRSKKGLEFIRSLRLLQLIKRLKVHFIMDGRFTAMNTPYFRRPAGTKIVPY